RRGAAVKNSKATALTEVLPRRELPAFPAGGCSRSWMADGAAGGEVGGRRELSGAVGGGSFDDAVLVRSRSIDCLDGDAASLQRRRLASAASAAFRPLVSESWPHHPDVLLRDSFSYSVSYLGFRPLTDHTDPTETAQVMQMFRCKSADILKLPRIRLTVCYRGVKFINPDNDMVITEHRITEIYFACQDNTRRANFAYVTKDSVNGVHYCHCFASHSPETAVLIIQTLSEACGLANQLIEFNQLRRQLQPDARRRSSRKRNKQT
uniref:PID domain-containing protein n=1 Tax=Macrostomum lignano TaxID=282301 RepID=A0A1I8J5M3_9PLAT